jgi:hypothetical protein
MISNFSLISMGTLGLFSLAGSILTKGWPNKENARKSKVAAWAMLVIFSAYSIINLASSVFDAIHIYSLIGCAAGFAGCIRSLLTKHPMASI